MKNRILGWIALVLVLAGLQAYAVYTLTNLKNRVNEASRDEASLQQQVDQMQEENADLQYDINNRNDASTLEDIARDELGLVMPDEIIFYDAGQ